MNRQYLDCRCALHPEGHFVAKTEKLKHALELKRAAIQVSLFYMISSQLLTLTKRVQIDATTSVPLSEAISTRPHSMDPDELASHIIALTINSDRNGDCDHDSKALQSKSNETNTMPQALSLAQSSIQSLVNDNHRVHINSRSSLHSSVAEVFSSHQSLDAPSRKMKELIQAIEHDIQISGQSLSFKDVPEAPILQNLLDTATDVVRSSASSLALVKSSNPKVIGHKANAVQMLQSLDGRISQLRTLLPPQTKRVSVDAGEYLSSSLFSSAHLIRSHPSQSCCTPRRHCPNHSDSGCHLPRCFWVKH